MEGPIFNQLMHIAIYFVLQSLAVMKTVDPVLSQLVFLAFCIILIGFVLKLLNQPSIIAYLIAGVIAGPYGLAIITDEVLIANLGSFGLELLLFFIGMEISISKLITGWRISVLGTLVQVLLSIAAVWVIGYFMEWEPTHIIMLGFVISLSSTAVVIKLLNDRKEVNSEIGQKVIGILLAQDIIIVPMLILLNYLSGHRPPSGDMLKQIVGGLLIIGIIGWVVKSRKIRLPFDTKIIRDHEMQVFIAFVFCFGFSLLTAFFGLSSALGAFVAGLLVSSARATYWVQESLNAFRVVFVALFFASVGMLIDLPFILENVTTVSILVLLVFIINSVINASIMRAFGEGWRESVYIGAILAQIGEFSFIVGATGFAMQIIGDFTYQLIISVISISLVISPFWILFVHYLLLRHKKN